MNLMKFDNMLSNLVEGLEKLGCSLIANPVATLSTPANTDVVAHSYMLSFAGSTLDAESADLKEMEELGWAYHEVYGWVFTTIG